MKRWLVVVLVLLAVIVLVSPGIVGRLAEHNLKNSIRWAESESEDFLVTEESFDRGWFTAAGRHRIELKDGRLRSTLLNLAGLREDDPMPVLIVDTRIDHGLVPLTSLSRESGSLMPGLASTVSTLQLDLGDGEAVPIPGILYSEIRLSGDTSSRWLLEAGTYENEGTALGWSGADVSFTTDPSGRRIKYDGSVEPVSIDAHGDRLRLGPMTFKGDIEQTAYGFATGAIALQMGSLSAARNHDRNKDTDNGMTIAFEQLTLDARSELDSGRVNGSSTIDIRNVVLPGAEEADVAMEVVLNRADAKSLQRIIAAVQNAQRADEPDAALAAAYPELERDIQEFLSAGVELRFDRIDIALPQGEVQTKLSVDLPATDLADGFSWPTLLLALTASADVRLPVPLMDIIEAANPQSTALVAMGILRKEGDTWVVNAQYAKGLLTVNGAPMPIPLPGR